MLFGSKPPVICALAVGHCRSAPGARNPTSGFTEWEFNATLASRIGDCCPDAVTIVHRGDGPAGYRELPGRINALKPRFIIELHCNAFDTRTSGTEVLHYRGSELGYRFASILQGHLLAALGLKNRGLKAVDLEGRGGYLLAHTEAPCLIAEPFFIDNDEDLAVASERSGNLIDGYVAAIEEMADLKTNLSC
jgi:N-acetylmuramoyl-L-alanine amidase